MFANSAGSSSSRYSRIPSLTACRKGEITLHMNERDFPHLVELMLPPGGFRHHIIGTLPVFH
jgi:hypothetical protein